MRARMYLPILSVVVTMFIALFLPAAVAAAPAQMGSIPANYTMSWPAVCGDPAASDQIFVNFFIVDKEKFEKGEIDAGVLMSGQRNNAAQYLNGKFGGSGLNPGFYVVVIDNAGKNCIAPALVEVASGDQYGSSQTATLQWPTALKPKPAAQDAKPAAKPKTVVTGTGLCMPINYITETGKAYVIVGDVYTGTVHMVPFRMDDEVVKTEERARALLTESAVVERKLQPVAVGEPIEVSAGSYHVFVNSFYLGVDHLKPGDKTASVDQPAHTCQRFSGADILLETGGFSLVGIGRAVLNRTLAQNDQGGIPWWGWVIGVVIVIAIVGLWWTGRRGSSNPASGNTPEARARIRLKNEEAERRRPPTQPSDGTS